MAKRKRRPVPGFVYFIRCPSNGRIKIGWTAGHPADRMRRIRMMSPVEVEPFGCFPGTRADERALHLRFTEHLSHGEWFSPTDELLAIIAEKTTPWEIRPPHRRGSVALPPLKPKLQDWANTTNLTYRGQTRSVAEWSKMLGVSHFQIKSRLAYGYSDAGALSGNIFS